MILRDIILKTSYLLKNNRNDIKRYNSKNFLFITYVISIII